ncbi:MAG: type I-C CRISPR-associated protein Cas7/Csd2 [Prosthecobacter sp.]|uniref:type I-C CRISPR-associated protein Cas7/Csd2 n=1 Tax=Prosthecobacter sp. TaxID=1965333 RepID=UPI00390234C1
MNNRHDFIYLFDVKDGNPNGDPDAGNLPRIDPETGHGLVTDVCLKRKVRNFVTITRNMESPFGIYVAEASVLGDAHTKAFAKLNISLGEDAKQTIEESDHDTLTDAGLPEGIRLEEEDDDKFSLVLEGTADKKAIKEWLKEKESELSKAHKKLITDLMKGAKGRKPTREETLSGRDQMCRDYYDIRTFGAVMALKSAPNCGQVRGPIQLSFARSIDPVVVSEHAITRMAVATQKEADKQSGDNRTMGRKFTVPYGLYMAHGFINPFLAKQTGFTDADLELFWDALKNMFEHDRSAARGLMSAQKLIVFQHDTPLGNAPANKLFDLVSVKRKAGVEVPRSFGDYEVSIGSPPNGVQIIDRL